jgi:low affinity Fe/Cu permease
MPQRQRGGFGHAAERFSTAVAHWTGRTPAFVLACAIVGAWLLSGPLFKFSDTWQLVINTGTTIITFLMVFLIQRSQNKEAMATQLKLNELVAAVKGASNRLIDVEELSEQELQVLQKHYARLVEVARNETDLTMSHSVEEADARHVHKTGSTKNSA